MKDSSAKKRILDAAEALFADKSFHATSLRDITTAAEVNLAAVNYYFGSKEALLDAVLERRLGPINTERSYSGLYPPVWSKNWNALSRASLGTLLPLPQAA